jgi:hypothetical protein
MGLSLSQIVRWFIEISVEISQRTLGDREISDTSPVLETYLFSTVRSSGYLLSGKGKLN